MKCLILTHKGLEQISAEEIKKLIPTTKISTEPGIVFAKVETEQDFANLCYNGRTFTKVTKLLGQAEFDAMPNVSNLLDTSSLKFERVQVTCEREGEHDFISQDVASDAHAFLREKGYAIDRKNPQVTFHIIVRDKTCYVTLDYSGADLGKRDYRIFLGRNSLKGTIAAGLLMVSKYKPEHNLVDPYCKYGIIPIEAALLSSNLSVHKFHKDKFAFTKHTPLIVEDDEKEFTGKIAAIDPLFPHINATKKNAKIAGVNKQISFSRLDISSLDIKFEPETIDRIATYPPQPSKGGSQKKQYEQLLNAAQVLLTKNGKLALIMTTGADSLKELAESYGLKLEKELEVYQGQEKLIFLLFNR